MTTRPRISKSIETRQFRPSTDVLAMRPEAIDFSYLLTGVRSNDRTEDNIAIVTINGPLEHHCDASGYFDSYEAIIERIEDAMTGRDVVKAQQLQSMFGGDEVDACEPIPASAVVLCIDSPGGEAAGATWAYRKIRSLRKQYGIPIYSYANEMACSAAYEIACAADEIWLPDTGTVGSIGVIATVFDRTEQNKKTGLHVELLTSGTNKADNHADRVLDDDIRERMQARVMKLAIVFWEVVAQARNTTPEAVASLEAGVFIGQDAVDVGIADAVASWDRFLRTVAASVADTDNLSASLDAA